MTTLERITIRNDIRPGDLGYIIFLHGTIYHHEYSHGVSFESIVAGGLHEFYSTYNPKKERLWIAEFNNEIIGSVALKNRQHTAQLRYFLIKPGFRGIGLGKKMMQLFDDFAEKCKYKDAYLWTTNELKAAAHLYKNHGFTLSQEKRSAAFGKQLTEQRYDKTF
jgi:N-acetylglutamate synthase-like GNAT family acetyltransferase